MSSASQTNSHNEHDKPVNKSREMSARSRIVSLVGGDFICFLIFASLGSSQHGEGFNLLYSLWLLVPFALAWFVVAPLLGAFSASIAARPTAMLLRTGLAWLAAWPVAMGLRWLLVDRVKVPATTLSAFLSFSVVALLVNIGLLLLWRWPFALNNDLRKRGV